MSIDVILTQKGLFKKPMPLEVILGKELAYGKMEGFRLIRGQLGETEFLAYHPEHIARGFSVIWSPEEKERIQLRALTPSTEAELRDFYDAVDRMVSYWNGRLEVDGGDGILPAAGLRGYVPEHSCWDERRFDPVFR